MMGRKNRVSLILALFAAVLTMMSCKDDDFLDDYSDTFDVYAQFQEDSVIITNYIEDNNLDAYEIDDWGVYISFYHFGDNDSLGQPTRDVDTSTTVQYVTVGYKGYFTDGTVFDETEAGETVSFALSNVISGWQIAIPEMSVGDSATVLIPSYWAYGHYGYATIPGDAVLLFDIYLESHERK